MGEIAKIIKREVDCLIESYITDGAYQEIEKEIIELIEKKVIPKQEDGNVALHRIGYNDCRKDIKQNLRLQN